MLISDFFSFTYLYTLDQVLNDICLGLKLLNTDVHKQYSTSVFNVVGELHLESKSRELYIMSYIYVNLYLC